MARLIAAVAFAILASTALGGFIPGYSYCDSASPSRTKILINNNYLALWQHTTSGEVTTSDCNRIYQYELDAFEKANATLNMLSTQSCYWENYGRVNWMTYNSKTDTIVASINIKSDSSQDYEATLTRCVEATAPTLNMGMYCGPSAALQVHGSFGFWYSTFGGGICLASGQFNPSSSTDAPIYNVQASYCQTSYLTDYAWWDRNANSISFAMDSNSRTVTLSKATCTATQDVILNNGMTYCVAANAANSEYSNAMFAAINSTAYIMNIASFGSSSATCQRIGYYETKGSAVSLWYSSTWNDCTTSQYSNALVKAEFFVGNNSWTFVDHGDRVFYATQCAAPAGSTVMPGQLWGSNNARLFIGANTMSVLGDVTSAVSYQSYYWRYVATGNTITTDLSDYAPYSATTVSVRSVTNISGALTTVVKVGTSVNAVTYGYAFLANQTLQAWPVPNGTWALTIGGASSMIVVSGNQMWLSLNGSAWVNNGPCMWNMKVVHRQGQVSYRITQGRCSITATQASITPDIIVQNLQYDPATAQITITLKNNDDGSVYTATSTTIADSMVLPVQYYCDYTPMPTTRMASAGNFIFYVSPTCMSLSRVTDTSATNITLVAEISSCGTTITTVEKLANNDVYFFHSAGYYEYTYQATGLRSCAIPSTTTVNATTGGYCGTIPAATTQMGTISFGLTSTYYTLVFNTDKTSDTCIFGGQFWTYATTLGYSNIGSSNACDDWRVVKIMLTQTGVDLYVQYNKGETVVASLTNGACTPLATGLTTGRYCPAPMAATVPALGQEAVAFGSYLAFQYADGQGSTRMYLVNVSSVTGAQQNVTWAANGAQWTWYTDRGYSTVSTVNLPYELYVTQMGTRGLSLTNIKMTAALSLDACNQTAMWYPRTVLGSSVIPELGGRVLAAFTSNNTFALTFPGTRATLGGYGDFRCYQAGYFDMASSLVSLTNANRNLYSCGSAFEIGRAQWDSATSSLWMQLSYNGATFDLVLSAANCSETGGIPTGVFCQSGSGYQAVGQYYCNAEYFWMADGATQISAFGNLTIAANKTVTAWTTGYNMLYSSQQNAAVGENTQLRYNGTSGLLYQSYFSAAAMTVTSMSWCPAADWSWAASDVWDVVPEATFCGSYNNKNATFTSVEGGYFSLAYSPEVATGAAAVTCYVTGSMMWHVPSGSLVMLPTLPSSSLSGTATGCYIASGGSWPSRYQPRLKFADMSYNNQTFSLKLTGDMFTALNGAGTFTNMVLNAGYCNNRIETWASLSGLPLKEGRYNAMGAGLRTQTTVVGDLYTEYIMRNSVVSMSIGHYVVPRRSVLKTVFGGQSYDFASNNKVALGVETITNATWVSPLLRLSQGWLRSGDDAWLTMPQTFISTSSIDNAANAAREEKEAEDKKKTVIIVIVVVVVVIALIAVVAVVVIKSRGSKTPVAQHNPDYRPMNSV